MCLFTIFVKCELTTFLGTFKILTGIPSVPVTFLGFKDLIILFTSVTFAVGNQNLDNLEFHFDYI